MPHQQTCVLYVLQDLKTHNTAVLADVVSSCKRLDPSFQPWQVEIVKYQHHQQSQGPSLGIASSIIGYFQDFRSRIWRTATSTVTQGATQHEQTVVHPQLQPGT
jgi:hypothetical protein